MSINYIGDINVGALVTHKAICKQTPWQLLIQDQKGIVIKKFGMRESIVVKFLDSSIYTKWDQKWGQVDADIKAIHFYYLYFDVVDNNYIQKNDVDFLTI